MAPRRRRVTVVAESGFHANPDTLVDGSGISPCGQPGVARRIGGGIGEQVLRWIARDQVREWRLVLVGWRRGPETITAGGAQRCSREGYRGLGVMQDFGVPGFQARLAGGR